MITAFSEDRIERVVEHEMNVLDRLLKQDPGFVDLDRAYEDQCADICGR